MVSESPSVCSGGIEIDVDGTNSGRGGKAHIVY